MDYLKQNGDEYNICWGHQKKLIFLIARLSRFVLVSVVGVHVKKSVWNEPCNLAFDQHCSFSRQKTWLFLAHVLCFFFFFLLSSREFRDGTTHEFTYLGRVWQNKKAGRAQCICSLSLKIIVTISCSVRERTKHAGCSRLSDLIVHCIFCTFINSRSRPAINKRL